MDVTTLSEWLKTTVPGIILLGAIGSLVAALAIWLTNRYLLRVLINAIVNSLAGILSHFAKFAARRLTLFVLRQGREKLQIFYTLQLMKLVLALFVATCAFVLFALALPQANEDLASASILGPLIVAFLGLWYSLRCIAIVTLPLYVDIENEIREAMAKVLAERKKENSG